MRRIRPTSQERMRINLLLGRQVAHLGSFYHRCPIVVIDHVLLYRPLIGGSLSRPVERFPSVFAGSEFFTRYPYFLPCAIPATFSVIAWAVTFFYLEEVCSSLIYLTLTLISSFSSS